MQYMHRFSPPVPRTQLDHSSNLLRKLCTGCHAAISSSPKWLFRSSNDDNFHQWIWGSTLRNEFHLSKTRQYANEFVNDDMNRIVYISHSKAVSGLVVHPDFHPSVKELNNIPEVDFHKSRNYYMHNTAFSKFPKRINKGSPITYGLEFQAHTKHGVQLLIDKWNGYTLTDTQIQVIWLKP